MSGQGAAQNATVAHDERPMHRSAFSAMIARATEPGTPKDFFKQCVGDLATHFGSPCVAGTVRFGPEVVTEIKAVDSLHRDTWKSVYEPLLLEAETEKRSRARLYDAKETGGQVVVLSVPLLAPSQETLGALVVIARCDQGEDADAALHELRACAGLISAGLGVVRQNAIPKRAQAKELENALIKSADYGSLRRLAFAITNNLRTKVGCDQVALGQYKRGKMTILSISGQDAVKPRSPGTLHMRQAMEECCDQRSSILYQNNPKWEKAATSSGFRLHKRWHESAGNANVLSVPLMMGERCAGVLSMRRPHDRPFIEDEIRKIEELSAPFAPVLPLMERADRGLGVHSLDSVHGFGRWLVAPTGWGRKVLALCVLGAAGFMFLGSRTYKVTVPCVINPSEIVSVAAPFEGVVTDAYVRSGDVVEAGQIMIRFDTSELELRRVELRSEVAAQQVEIDRALRDKDVSSAALADAQKRTLLAQLAMVEESIERGTIRADANGRVISGDLRKRIGQTFTHGEQLLEVAPDSGWQVELEVPERLAADVDAGLIGEFSSYAMPDRRQECVIASVRPSAEVRDGKNVFIAEAPVDAVPGWMKSGMEGVARVEVGKRKNWWLLTHRAFEWAHMRFWL